LPIFIPPIAPQSSSSIIWGWYNRPIVAAVPSGLSLTPLRIIKIKNGEGQYTHRTVALVKKKKKKKICSIFFSGSFILTH
jgi:hypothetical protein